MCMRFLLLILFAVCLVFMLVPQAEAKLTDRGAPVDVAVAVVPTLTVQASNCCPSVATVQAVQVQTVQVAVTAGTRGLTIVERFKLRRQANVEARKLARSLQVPTYEAVAVVQASSACLGLSDE